MKAREVIVELGKLHPESEVYLASDGEGNSYRPVSQVEEACVRVDGYDVTIVDNDREKEFDVSKVAMIWPAW